MMANDILSIPQKIYMIAGEASGDLLGGDLMISLKKKNPSASFWGIGGEKMMAQGLKSLFPMEELSIMGLGGILKNIFSLKRRINETIQNILSVKPDLLVTIDAPEFSLRVAKAIRRMRDKGQLDFSVKIMHEVAPTVWAWRPGRAKKMAAIYDHLLCLYPMEPPLFEAHGLKSTFIGHPVVKEPLGEAQIFWETTGLDSAKPLLCVLPGSRRSEVTRLLPVFGAVVERLREKHPGLQVVIPTVPQVKSLVVEGTSNWFFRPLIVEGDLMRRYAFAASSAGLAASGTVALQLAHARVPFVIAYKIDPISAMIARRLLVTKWACMVNILAGHEIIPECIQENCHPEFIVDVLDPLLGTGADSQKKAVGNVMSTLTDQTGIQEILLSSIGEKCCGDSGPKA